MTGEATTSKRALEDARPMETKVVQLSAGECDTACTNDCAQSCGCEQDCAASCGCDCADE